MSRRFRFGLRWMLAIVAVACIPMTILHFKVVGHVTTSDQFSATYVPTGYPAVAYFDCRTPRIAAKVADRFPYRRFRDSVRKAIQKDSGYTGWDLPRLGSAVEVSGEVVVLSCKYAHWGRRSLDLSSWSPRFDLDDPEAQVRNALIQRRKLRLSSGSPPIVS